MKEIKRSKSNRKLAGVIGGLAERFNINANLLRLIFIIGIISTGFFPLAIIYLVLVYVLPNEV
ncbi:PspC domain-containing protein [Niallia sp. NCCP-28]|uniref:PspC domain-containing protein n=1 Tax=Niallia sp. NCCP-28 TaxID=2934712 RepID=UPI0020817CA1|nr:PspC domain-containing protein [Niallia sp. NCCP-28]GKU83337.1 putative membrane protein YvlC [Niallia sp. NCCP-28]